MSSRFLALVAFLSFSNVFSTMVIAPLITPIGRDFDVPAGVIGLAAAAYGVPGLPMGFLVGPYSDRFGRKPFLVGGALVVGGFNLLSALAPSFPLLVLGRILAGVGAPMVFTAIQATLADEIPYASRGRVSSIVLTANQAAPLAGIPLAGVLAELVSWRLAFGVVGACGIIGALLGLRLFPKSVHPPNLVGRSALYGQVFRNASARLGLVGFTLGQIAWFAWVPFFVVFLERTYSLSPATAAVVALTNGVGILVGGIAGGRFGDRLGHRRMLIPATFGLGVVWVAITSVGGPLPLGMALLFCVSLLSGVRFNCTAVLLVEQAPAARGTMAALMASTNSSGQTFGPLFGGLLLDAFGFGSLGLLCAVMSSLSAVAFLGVIERRDLHVEVPAEAVP